MKAALNNYRQSPRKVRLVANLIRGRSLAEAEVQLQNLSKAASRPLLKLLRSAAANFKAENLAVDPALLRIKELRVDAGRTLKRFRPRAFGRSAPIRKRTSHIILKLEVKTPKREVSLK